MEIKDCIEDHEKTFLNEQKTCESLSKFSAKMQMQGVGDMLGSYTSVWATQQGATTSHWAGSHFRSILNELLLVQGIVNLFSQCAEQCSSQCLVSVQSFPFPSPFDVGRAPLLPYDPTRGLPNFSLLPSLAKTSLDALHNHAALKLCENSEHLKEQLAGWSGGVNALLVEIEIGVFTVEFAEKGDEVLKTTAQAIHRPRSHQVELASTMPLYSASNAGRPLDLSSR